MYIFYLKGKAQIRASRTFKYGEEFLINYDNIETISNIFNTEKYLIIEISINSDKIDILYFKYEKSGKSLKKHSKKS